jgi:hypothetical protein
MAVTTRYLNHEHRLLPRRQHSVPGFCPRFHLTDSSIKRLEGTSKTWKVKAAVFGGWIKAVTDASVIHLKWYLAIAAQTPLHRRVKYQALSYRLTTWSRII